MGLFDFFRKNDKEEEDEQELNNEIDYRALYADIKKYNEYIVKYMHMDTQDDHSPISAYESKDGNVTGFLFVSPSVTYNLTKNMVIVNMKNKLEIKLLKNEINSYVILYHSNQTEDDLICEDDEATAIIVDYHFKNGKRGNIEFPYGDDGDNLYFDGFINFNQEENSEIFGTKLNDETNYFEDIEIIKIPVTTNKWGIEMKKSNILNVRYIWCGIFGFDKYQDPNTSQIMVNHINLLKNVEPSFDNDRIMICEKSYEDIIIKRIALSNFNLLKTFLPVIKTHKEITVENKIIDEWENSDNVEAIITGETIQDLPISYYVTDYAENRNRYLSEKNLTINVSGIIFQLDSVEPEIIEYSPSNEIENYACFNFTGYLIDFKATSFLENNIQKGYIVTLQINNHTETEQSFLIDAYVTDENMNCKELNKGMGLKGMLQMQGKISN